MCVQRQSWYIVDKYIELAFIPFISFISQALVTDCVHTSLSNSGGNVTMYYS